MPKLVPEKIRQIIKNHVFRKSKTMQIHCKGYRFRRFCKMGARTWNSLKNDQTCHQNPYQNGWQIDTNSMLEKVMQKTLEISQTGDRKEDKNRDIFEEMKDYFSKVFCLFPPPGCRRGRAGKGLPCDNDNEKWKCGSWCFESFFWFAARKWKLKHYEPIRDRKEQRILWTEKWKDKQNTTSRTRRQGRRI